MSVSKALIFEGVGCVEVLAGLVVNTFITAINLRDWWTSRKLKPYDKIMANLGFSRVFLLICFFLRIVNRISKLNVYSSPAQRCAFRTAQLLFDFASLWFAMWLCLLYFVKVTMFKNHFFVWVKLRIPQLVPPVVIITYVASFIFGFIYAFSVGETSDVMDGVNLPTNRSVYKELSYMIPLYFIGHVLPFICVSISTSLLIQTIGHHIRHVKANITGFKRPRLDAHLSAIRSAVLLEFMTISNLLATFIFHFDFYGYFEANVSVLFLVSYPLFHSLVIVTGNVKLKRVLWGIVDCVKGKLAIERCLISQHIESKRETNAQQK
ncbi:PREDICTED: taste receptor type 2 member 39-like [Nanorana parkeri]|uniref:taste receptor type 2 member 39-like n=1 Tax=Nanorana parkeri TaxID=125878 RepID=UPI000853FF90|nr:PREDICTED: taste receptor type 2 member 39-like [Nanorana parkeri]